MIENRGGVTRRPQGTDFEPLPADAARALLPGEPIQCRGVVALPDPLPSLEQP